MAGSKTMRPVRAALILLLTATAHAGGPRWVTGPPYFYVPAGQPVTWYTNNLSYFTDPADLSPWVTHAQADSLVAAAATTWNTPIAAITLTAGGTLSQPLDPATLYLDTTGLVLPSELQPSASLTKPLAILYDRSGALTDLLLGTGASDPSSCRQNAVTESVDSISPDGHIRHALLILNGRCTGPAPEQQLQLRYQLTRAFGRILGLAWSQANDNVFTGTPRASYNQALHWPIMHPIDVVCGPYTYQCMPQPFTLRDDDLSALSALYPVGPWNIAAFAPGHEHTFLHANRVRGAITFPNGQGMAGVNVVVHRNEPFWDTPEPWESVSSASGFAFRHNSTTPLTPTTATSLNASLGSTDPALEGYYDLYRIPLPLNEDWQNLYVTTQPINPLYTGLYTVGPYDANAVTPSGFTSTQHAWTVANYSDTTLNFAAASPADTCPATTVTTPFNPTGWRTGTLCGYNHTDWSTFSVQSNRTLTIEVTSQDESNYPSTTKALPILGLWNIPPATNVSPDSATLTAFNSPIAATTTLTLQTTTARTLTLAIADQRGDGRPDYHYQARILYAESVSPTNLPATGGTITLTGMGFRRGNAVYINNTLATVNSWTANTITASAPNLRATSSLTADITVRDLATGGATNIPAALTYAAPIILRTITATQPTLYLAASTPYTWSPTLTLTDNLNSTTNLPVTWTTTAPTLTLATPQTLTNQQGNTTNTLITAPLIAPAQSTTTACAWPTNPAPTPTPGASSGTSAGTSPGNGTSTSSPNNNLCTILTIQSVDPADYRITPISGTTQSIPATANYAPVTLQITAPTGHPIAAAPVQIHQTFEPWQPLCPTRGRCPIAPITDTLTTDTLTNLNGLTTFTPLTPSNAPPGTAGTTHIAITTGTQTLLPLSLQKTP